MCFVRRVAAVGCFLIWATVAWGDTAQIKKLLPHFLDQEGRHAVSPSLYERDAYQAYLRRHPELRSGIRFDLLFRAPRSSQLAARLELRGSKGNRPTEVTVQLPLADHRGGRAWRTAYLRGTDYGNLGELLAWRATLWEGDRLLAEAKSFLW